MKHLIVNADDFGASHGINRGILEAHRYGILTSTSLQVDAPFSEEAAKLAHEAWALSVGLHFDLDNALSGRGAAFPEQISDAVGAQFARFIVLMGQAPTHLDSHHNVHRDPRVLPHLSSWPQDMACRCGNIPRCATCRVFTAGGTESPTWNRSARRVCRACWR